MPGPFRMKGYNYPGTSPMRGEPSKTHKHPDDHELPTTESLNTGSVGNIKGGTSESLIARDLKVENMKAGTGSVKENLEATYPGTEWNRTATKNNSRGVWMTNSGKLLSDM